ncbi:MAG: PilN domain-containing protein [Nitrospirae bacterium]|nr:PilN domain-containing protein [Nitrospirota bacterium]MBI4838442.1 PilN domain-containing protein [Nitrospirota bacterium]
MIRVNLLPPELRKKVKPVPGVLVISTFITVAAILVLGGVTFFLTSKISDLKADKTLKEKRLAELQTMIKEIKDYEKDNKSFQDRNNIIEQLRKNQNIPLILLDEISELLPKGVWLTSLSESGGVVNISGYAYTNPDIVNYVENLKKSEKLIDTALLESRNATIDNISVYQFKLTFRVKL